MNNKQQMKYTHLGELGEIINTIQYYIKENITKSLNANEILDLKKNLYDELTLKKFNVDFYTVDDIVNRFFKCQYKFNKKLDFSNGNNGFRNLDQKYNLVETNNELISVPSKFKQLESHFQKLYNLPQPEQRSEEWFNYRFNRITASDTATALDLNPYEPVEEFFIKKCTPDYPFLDNKFVFHGKKYEQIATQLYEHIYNTKVTEFGCLPSEKYKILGASPDGICSKSTLNNKFSDRLGTMLEIKCPFSREIKTSGKIEGDICPFYYYCQVQQQLECCDLDNCDFWQCKIVEYKSRDEYILDNFTPVLTEGIDSTKKDLDKNWTRGCLMQFLPKTYEPTHKDDKHEYKSHYIYPPRLDMTIAEYDNWILYELSTWQTKYKDVAKNYYFDKIIYWKIPKSHNVTIVRNKEWFNNIYPILKETWDNVLHYRKNLNDLDNLQHISKKRKQFYKMNTNIKISNNKVGLSIQTNDEDEAEYNCDFVD